MPSMTENSNCYNPNRSEIKNDIIASRARNLLSDNDFDYLCEVLNICSHKKLDRDIELGIALDVMELLDATKHYADGAQLGDFEIRREVDLGRISPADGLIARNFIEHFTPDTFDISKYLSDDSYLKEVKNNNFPEEPDVIGLKSCLYIYSANALMDENSCKRFQKFISENPDLVINLDMEFNIFFNLLDALYAGVDDHIAASIMATDINREIALKRIKPESTAFIHYLVTNFAPETFINKSYVSTNYRNSEHVDIKSLNLKSSEEK